jgi:hypothetical protein
MEILMIVTPELLQGFVHGQMEKGIISAKRLTYRGEIASIYVNTCISPNAVTTIVRFTFEWWASCRHAHSQTGWTLVPRSPLEIIVSNCTISQIGERLSFYDKESDYSFLLFPRGDSMLVDKDDIAPS